MRRTRQERNGSGAKIGAMQVSLRLFAGLRDLIGSRELVLDLPEGARLEDLRTRLAQDYPRVGSMIGTVVFAIDDEYVPAEERLHDGAQVALIPPVSGG